jgi:hypothetical protein
MSQPPSPAATIVTILPHHLESRSVLPVPSHPFGDFKDKPAQRSEADAPEKHDRPSPSLSTFLQGAYALSRSMASNKLLRSNRRGKGVHTARNSRDVIKVGEQKGRLDSPRMRLSSPSQCG